MCRLGVGCDRDNMYELLTLCRRTGLSQFVANKLDSTVSNLLLIRLNRSAIFYLG